MSTPQFPMAPPSAPYIAPKGSNGLAVAGFVLGLLGLIGSFIPVVNVGAIVLAVIGLVLAAIGVARSRAARAGKGLAIAGVVMSVLAIVIAVIIDVAVGNAVHDAVSTSVTPPASTQPGTHSGAGTSRTDPAPLGSAVTGGDWTVTVNSVTTATSDSLGQKPAAGKMLLVVDLTATYNGHDAQGDTSFATVKYVAPDGTSYDGLDDDKVFIPKHQFDMTKTLYAGGSETGDELIQVPADGGKGGVLAVSPSMLSDDTFISLK